MHRQADAVFGGYSGKDGVTIGELVVVGSNRRSNYGCMGRCGTDCTGFGGGWTKECSVLDSCSYKFKASGGQRRPQFRR